MPVPSLTCVGFMVLVLHLGSGVGAEQFSAEAGGSNAMCLEGDGEELLVQEQIEAINI